MFFFKKKNKGEDTSNEPAVAAVIKNPTQSLIFQDILKENEIPFVCRQSGAGGYTKHILGAGFAADMIYVAERDLERAAGLYEAYIANESETEIEYFEEE